MSWSSHRRVYVLVLLASACTNRVVTSNARTVTEDGDDSGSAWWADDDAGVGDNGPGQPVRSEEACDGLDNDLDGEVDEDTSGAPCIGASGVAGVENCVAGRAVCYECTPGASRDRDCGCSVKTKDVCNDSGRWISGVCDACDTLTTTSCGVDADCKPGETRVQRCDTCPVGQDCGSSCIGATFVCDASCTWKQQSACAVQAPVCDRDSKTIKECGNCGRREVTCDGCFFVESKCNDQGACTPGDSHATPCFANGCADGYIATSTCNDQCSWEPLTTCDGCTPGRTSTIETLCVDDHAECGKRVQRVECLSASTAADACQDDPVTHGVSRTTTVSNDCGGVVRPNFCTPGRVTIEQVSCGANTCGATFTRTTTCFANGCGASTSDGGGCPECRAGETQTRSCTSGGLACGTQSRTCTSGCGWGAWSGCTAAPTCEAGTVENRPCTAACNKSGTSMWRCNGCGWTQISSCESNDVQCEPGDVQDLGPCPHCRTTRQTKTCDAASCTWKVSTCPVCE